MFFLKNQLSFSSTLQIVAIEWQVRVTKIEIEKPSINHFDAILIIPWQISNALAPPRLTPGLSQVQRRAQHQN